MESIIKNVVVDIVTGVILAGGLLTSFLWWLNHRGPQG